MPFTPFVPSSSGLTLPLVVAQGGTGQSTLAAFELLAGGVTSTSPPQSVTPGASGTYLQSKGAAAVPAYVSALTPVATSLVDAASVPVDASLGNYFQLLMTSAIGATRTIAAPTNAADGDTLVFAFQQPAAGGPCSPAFAAGAGAYTFGADGTPTWSTTASLLDVIGFRYDSLIGKWVCQGWKLGNS